jgi:hypothetical protein
MCGWRVWEDLCLGGFFAGLFDALLGSHLVGMFLREVMISVSYECVAWELRQGYLEWMLVLMP